ncbi:hypothetical protein [Dyella telluris]|uniref:Uncharacterized protein n=1 Tax=Dyella telluris TaxID=2763498 RepID=A0A7G8Q595_9GAMM|nr:hypothetical protein [Dyella telluris]QNK01953.1 hypothetical protein H8F01_01890 [Dyella telluris]
MTSRLLRSRFAVFLAFLFGLLLLVGTPVRPVQLSSDASGDKAVASLVLADDVADTAADDGDASSPEDTSSTNGGMDDILHPFDVAYLWVPMPTQAPASVSYDLSLHAPASLLRPPEAV